MHNVLINTHVNKSELTFVSGSCVFGLGKKTILKVSLFPAAVFKTMMLCWTRSRSQRGFMTWFTSQHDTGAERVSWEVRFIWRASVLSKIILWTNLQFISRPGETEVVTPQTSINLNGCLSPGSKVGKPGLRLLPLHPSRIQQATTQRSCPLSSNTLLRQPPWISWTWQWNQNQFMIPALCMI